MVPYNHPNSPDNFDFYSSDYATQIGNAILEPEIDPVSIGRTVQFEFTNIDLVSKISHYGINEYLDDVEKYENTYVSLDLFNIYTKVDSLSRSLYENGITTSIRDVKQVFTGIEYFHYTRPSDYEPPTYKTAHVFGTNSDDYINISSDLIPLSSSWINIEDFDVIAYLAGEGNDHISVINFHEKDILIRGGAGNDNIDLSLAQISPFGEEDLTSYGYTDITVFFAAGDGDDTILLKRNPYFSLGDKYFADTSVSQPSYLMAHNVVMENLTKNDISMSFHKEDTVRLFDKNLDGSLDYGNYVGRIDFGTVQAHVDATGDSILFGSIFVRYDENDQFDYMGFEGSRLAFSNGDSVISADLNDYLIL